MVELISDKLPKYLNVNPQEIQVLTPMKKGDLGTEELNRVLQQYLNPPAPDKKEYKTGDERLFREGDKVMQIKNNYQIEWEVRSKYGIPIDSGVGVFNGDVGRIKNIDSNNQTITVEYDECKQVDYTYSMLDELELAYAITVHKSQGSEYPAVVMPLLMGPRMLMNRNLLYTAITRAKNLVTILGSKEAVYTMIRNKRENERYTSLDERIHELNVKE
jgi:exodeoxyribonuclease V alpha subunit